MSIATASFRARCARYFLRPLSIGRAFDIAAAVGTALPLVGVFAGQAFSIEAVLLATHYVFPSVAAIVLGLLYWRLEPGKLRRSRRATVGAVGLAGVWVLGLVGSGWCCAHHICMDGHMAHPPYDWWHYGIDAGWVLGLVTASLWLRILQVSLSIAFAGIASFLISYRLLFGSFGGIYEWLPL